MASKLVDMGIPRKEMYSGDKPSPTSEKDYQKEKVYPELNLSGPAAEMMGAADLKEGDLIEQTVRWRVKRHSKTTEKGKTDYSMTLCLEKASDCEDCGSDATDTADEGDEGDSSGASSAMNYIEGRAKSAD